MREELTLNPTSDQTFEIAGRDARYFSRTLAEARALQRQGRVEEACNSRFRAFQRLSELLPENEEVVLEWNDGNTRAAIEMVYESAIDHFLIDDFEMSAAMLELLLELDPEDHLEGIILLAFDYLAMEEYELFDEISNDISDKYVSKEILTMWAAFRREGRIPDGEVMRFRTKFAPYYAEFTAPSHTADEEYLRDIESERPTDRALARELWLRTENLWALHPGFIEALH